MIISKITLGTAQIGMNYGIANLNGKPDFNTSLKILNFAWKHGINSFDTSPTYGNSEEIIGTFISSLKSIDLNKIIIISKLPKINRKKVKNFNDLYQQIRDYIHQSLNNLKLNSIPVYLLHHAPDIYFKDGLAIKCLNQLKSDGLINKFGLSIYNPKEVETSLMYDEIDVIQVPINVFDNRLIKTGLLEKLNKNNYIIFARSIYLQGLFFLSPNKLKKSFKIVAEPLIKLRELTREYKTTLTELPFLYIRDLPEITSLVIGSEKIKQLSENLSILNKNPLPIELIDKIKEYFSNISETIINPSLWKV